MIAGINSTDDYRKKNDNELITPEEHHYLTRMCIAVFISNGWMMKEESVDGGEGDQYE